MVYKFEISEGVSNQVEEQRALSGDYHPYVMLWDWIKGLRRDSKEELIAEVEHKLGATEKSFIKIVGVKDGNKRD